MKKILIAIPALLALSGCVTSLEGYSIYKNECKNLSAPHFNESLFNKFLDERNILVINDYSTDCSLDSVCSRLTEKDRWENIKIFKSEKDNRIYRRDYSLKNCKITGILGPNIYTKNGKNFCISELKNNLDIDFKIRYESKSNYSYNKKNVYVTKKYDYLYYNNELILSREAIIYQAPTAHDTCKSDEKIYKTLIKNI